MFFGLFNASASFQSYINKILANKVNFFVTIYLDNILTYTKNSRQAHIDTVKWVPDIM